MQRSVWFSVSLSLVMGCVGQKTPTCPAAPYADPGEYAVGLASLVTDATDAGVPVAVWYPSDAKQGALASYDLRDWLPQTEQGKIPDAEKPTHEMTATLDLPVAKGRFPIVLFSHGLGGYRFQSSFLMSHLASWGFVVVAPEHPERNLTAALLGKFGDFSPEQLRAALAAVSADSRFAAHLDPNHVAATGHSAGGAAVSIVSADANIETWVMLASQGLGPGPDGKPSLMMCGKSDQIAVCNQVARSWAEQPAPTRFAQLNQVGHLGFTDLCTIATASGGILPLAQKYGVDGVNDLLIMLSTDGCRTTDLPSEQGWPVINHYVTAHLRAAFGIDAKLVGYDDAAATCFGRRVASVDQHSQTDGGL
jgi:dienelactone hydrolase